MDGIIIQSFDLSNEDEYNAFIKFYLKEFLNLLSKAYGGRYWGNKDYIKKLAKRNLIITLALNQEKKIISTIFLTKVGKLSGLAVLNKYRQSGLATFLIQLIQKKYDHLFVEIATDNLIMRNLLLKLNFAMLKDKNRIKRLLSYESITFLDSEKDFISYYHGNRSRVHWKRKFIMFEYNRVDK